MLIGLFHILFLGPLLIYVGLQRNLSHIFYQGLFFLGIGVILLHLFKALKKLPKFAYFNYIHALLFGPLLVFIGYYERSSPLFIYNIMTFLGVLVIFYNGIKILKGKH